MVDVIQLLKQILYKLGLIADYVVEQGTDGIWTYRKWNSGVAECWGAHDIYSITNYTVILNYFGGYYYDVAFPTGLFNDRPIVNYSALLGAGFSLTGTINSLTDKSNVRCFIMSTEKGTVNGTLYITAKGRWK